MIGHSGMADRPGPRGEVPAVAAAIRILHHLAAAQTPQAVTSLARALGLNTSTCFNILRTLAQGELVRFDAERKTYALDLGLVDLARAAFGRGGDLAQVQPMLRQLALRHGLTATLWQPAGMDRMLLSMVAEGDGVVRIRMSVGQRLPVLIGAMGRVAAAFGGMGEDELRRHFEALRWQRPFPFAAFLEQAEDTRRRGWALDDGDYLTGVTTLSAPIPPAGGPGVAVASATMFGGQHGPAALQAIGVELCALAKDIGRSLTFN